MTKSSLQTFALVSLIISCTGLLAGCGEDKKAIAAEAARAWTNNSVNQVSDAVAEVVIGEEPIFTPLASGALAGLIRQNLSWDYSAPERISDDRYSIIATAKADVKIETLPLVDKSYVVSLPFNLDIDTDAKSVLRWVPDFRSAKIDERDS